MPIVLSGGGLGGTVTLPIDLTTDVTGVLPIAHGGTNQSAALNNGRVIISSGGAMIENAALTASRVMKTTAGGLPTTGQVTLSDTNEITGTLAIANGGTGQTSQTNAFDALAPTTTLGDIIYYNGSDNIRLGIGSSAQVLTVSGGVPTWAAASSTAGTLNSACNGRLTTQSGVAVSTADRTSQGTIYFTPYGGNSIALYDGSTSWPVSAFNTEISLALTVTSGNNYDVFVYNNSGTLTLELSNAWTSNTVRNDSLTTQNGVYVKSSNTTRRYIGTIRASGSNVTEDSSSKRYVYNYYNRVRRGMYVIDTTDSWTYTTNAWRQANNNSANKVEFVNGIDEEIFLAEVVGLWGNATANNAAVGVGLDSTTTILSTCVRSGIVGYYYTSTYANAWGYSGIGYHYLSWNENSVNPGTTTTWYGDAGAGAGGTEQSGLTATIMN